MRCATVVLIGLFAFISACTPNNVQNDASIGKILDSAGMYGSFALLDNGTEQFVIHNLAAYKDSAVAPLNTFFLIDAAKEEVLIHLIENNYVNEEIADYCGDIINGKFKLLEK